MLEDVLCELCLQALTLDDARAGGSVIMPTTTAAHPALGFFKFDNGPSSYETVAGDSWLREYHLRSSTYSSSDEDIEDGPAHRPCIADMVLERSTIAPALKELASQTKSGFGTCQFCQILRDIFTKTYHKRTWWETEGRCIRFRIRYEWVRRPMEHKEQEYELNGVTVMVSTLPPAYRSDMLHLMQFALAAWPGRLHLLCVSKRL
jgi:hypothetical protein